MDLELISRALILAENGDSKRLEKLIQNSVQSGTIYDFLIKSKSLISVGKLGDAENFLLRIKEKAKNLKDVRCKDFVKAHTAIIEAEIKMNKGDKNEGISDLEGFLVKYPSCIYNIEIEKTLKKIKASEMEEVIGDKDLEKRRFLKLYAENYAVTPNTKWHVLNSEWFARWQKWVNLSASELPFSFNFSTSERVCTPGKIDNSNILIEKTASDYFEDDIHPYFNFLLKPGLVEGVDYVLVPDKAFQIFINKYAVSQDIIRFSIEQNDTIYQIEVYLKEITLAFVKNNELIIKKFNTSRKNNISHIKKLVLKHQNLHTQSRAWKINLHKINLKKLSTICTKTFTVYIEGVIIEEETIIDDAEISEANVLLIEVSRNNKYTYSDDKTLALGKCCFCQNSSPKVQCKKCKKKLYCSEECLNFDFEDHRLVCKAKKKTFFSFLSCFCRPSTNLSDVEEDHSLPMSFKPSSLKKFVGLQNLGNTCFMNSAIQCLTHTKALSDFFLSGEYSYKINKSNPLGTKGKLASAYAELLHMMQSSNEKSVAPWKLKKTIAEFAPQFLGHQQHDSHELLLFLISGLHEDLNQVTKKPYYESDVKESTDREMANESWRRHLSRNQSVIVNLMYGQYKSTLQCPKCHKFSYAFDPFNCLSLPIPQSLQKKIQIFFVPYSSNESVLNFTFIGDPHTSIAQIQEKLKEHLKNEHANLIPLYTKEGNMNIANFGGIIDEIKSSNIFFYEIPNEFEEFVVVNISKENSFAAECFPRIIAVNKGYTFVDLHKVIFEYMKPFYGKIGINDNFSVFYDKKVYKIRFEASRLSPCLLCMDKKCSGCEIKPEMIRIYNFLKSSSFFTVSFTILLNNFKKNIDFSQLKRTIQSKMIAENSVKKNFTIYECFKTFSLPETLDKNNLWYCPSCKMHVQASKKLEIFKVPPILIIHLKRFKTHGFYREKLNIPIEFPKKNLDISEHVIGERPPVYDLYAVSNHFGALAGGHYTATVATDDGEKWLNCNDSDVSECKDISEVSSYVLFYKARN